MIYYILTALILVQCASLQAMKTNVVKPNDALRVVESLIDRNNANRNPVLALQYLEPVAEQNHDPAGYQAIACATLGELYRRGDEGIARNPIKALKYLETATQYPTTQAIAWVMIGETYWDKCDMVSAVPYLEKAAQQNNDRQSQARACVLLGQIYRHGDVGIARDRIKALKYLKTATQHPLTQAIAFITIGDIYYRDDCDMMSAIRYFEYAALQNIYPEFQVYAWVILGEIYLRGNNDVQPDHERAQHYLDLVAQTSDDIQHQVQDMIARRSQS